MGRRITHPNFWMNVDKSGDCWEWTAGKDNCGYGHLWHNKKKTGAHRVAYELAIGPISKGLCICHTCDNPGCVNPDHLWIGTHQDNMTDRNKKGRGHKFCTGEKNHRAKLCNLDVWLIRELLKTETPREIGDWFGITQTHARKIGKRVLWPYVH